jgi:NADPH:quinone reductase-like Zn-dependent oxidoreductase
VKAVLVRRHGGLNALCFETVPDPKPAADEVLVEVKACAANHLDLWVRRGVPGHKFPLPLILGNDVAGVIREAGGRADGVKPGDEVVIAPGLSCGRCPACFSGLDNHCRSYGILGETRDGGYAQYVVVPRANILPKPKNLSFEEAASMPLTFLTAWHMLLGRAELKPGEAVLIQAAGSGVSTAGIQIAKLFHATVIATAGSDEKCEQAQKLGADHAINYARQNVLEEVARLTEKKGVEIAFDHVGEATWETSVKALAWQGRLVTCGATTGAEGKINLRVLFFKQLSILGSTMGSKAELCEVLKHAEAGRLKPVVDRVMPLSEAREAHRLIEERQIFGKIVLIP